MRKSREKEGGRDWQGSEKNKQKNPHLKKTDKFGQFFQGSSPLNLCVCVCSVRKGDISGNNYCIVP